MKHYFIISALISVCIFGGLLYAEEVPTAPVPEPVKEEQPTQPAPPTAKEPAAQKDKATVQKDPVQKKEQKITFNFVDVELTAVAKFVSDITGKNFIFDERVKGKITIIAPSKLGVDDAFNLFTSVLRLKGFTLVPSGFDAFKIVPSVEAKQSGVELAVDGLVVNETYIARLIPLKYISSDDAVKFIQPVISRDGHVSSFGPGNLILLVDSGLNIERALSLVNAIDQPAVSEDPEVVFLNNSNAEPMSKVLNDGLARPGKTPPSQTKIVADQRLNAVVIFGDRAAKDAAKKLITLLDVPAAKEQGAINVYFLENADAEDLSKVIDGLIKGQSAPGKPVAPGGPSIFDAQVTITPDKATNALVIVAPPSAYQSIVEVIKQLDKRRMQVFVEAMIVEASMDKLRELGSKWRVLGEDNGAPIIVGGMGTIDSSAVAGIVQGLSGMTVGGMGNFMDINVTKPDGTQSTLNVPGFAALFSLSDFRGAVNVLSTPQILTSNNIEAEIMVGENVPFISKIERGLTAGDQVPFSSIERKDVGITLRITPQITEGGFVKLEMYQEISSVKKPAVAVEETLAAAVGPTTTKRSTKTTVVVKDKQTVVIGGLMQEKEDTTIRKMPLLGDIPILGWLFKSKSSTKGKTNLLVFLTPHIMDAEGLSDYTEKKQREFAIGEKEYVEGMLLVKFRPDVSEDTAHSIISFRKGTIEKSKDGLYLIKLGEGQSVKSAIKEFQKLKEVEYAEPNYRMKALE